MSIFQLFCRFFAQLLSESCSCPKNGSRITFQRASSQYPSPRPNKKLFVIFYLEIALNLCCQLFLPVFAKKCRFSTSNLQNNVTSCFPFPKMGLGLPCGKKQEKYKIQVFMGVQKKYWLLAPYFLQASSIGGFSGMSSTMAKLFLNKNSLKN